MRLGATPGEVTSARTTADRFDDPNVVKLVPRARRRIITLLMAAFQFSVPDSMAQRHSPEVARNLHAPPKAGHFTLKWS